MALEPGDEITVAVPLENRTVKYRGVFLRFDERGDIRFYTYDYRGQSAAFRAARPDWFVRKHRKHLFPTPTRLIEQEAT